MHAAVWVNGGNFPHHPNHRKALVIVLGFFASLLFGTLSAAQPVDDADELVRREQRFNDQTGETKPRTEDLSLPSGEGGAADVPDAAQQQLLLDLQSKLLAEPNDVVAREQLAALLNDLLSRANAASEAWQLPVAGALLDVVRGVDAEHAGLQDAQLRLDSRIEAQAWLDAAREAMAAGRVDEPAEDCAWYFYRRVHELFPENEQARLGLAAVQQDLLARALVDAEDLDFDSAELLLLDAAGVFEDQAAVEQTRDVIARIKSDHAEALELQAIDLMDAGDFSASERKLIDLIALGGQADRVSQLRARMKEARVYGGFKPGQVIRDRFTVAGIFAPELVVIPAGSYMMGSKKKEKGRVENESPRHRVAIKRGFAIGRREISVAEFGAFVSLSAYRTSAERHRRSIAYDPASGRLAEMNDVHWKMDYEGKAASPDDPVIHVSWDDAQAYVAWLSEGTAKSYRLPSEAEFEYVLRAGSTTRYWWGNGSPDTVVENLTGELDASRSQRRWVVAFSGYTDRFWGPAPVASFAPHPHGVFDLGGNVAEWVGDCWHDTYVRAPRDGSAWINPGCEQHVIRGGYWASAPEQTRSAFRHFARSDYHDARVGFRIARDL